MIEHVRITIEGMTCASCVSRISRAVRKLDGVESIRVHFAADSAEVAFDPSRTSLPAIADSVRRAGYEVRIERAEPFIPAARRGFLFRLSQGGKGMSILATLSSLPIRYKLMAALAVVVAALLVAGVPLSTFVPFAGVAGCLGMHFFMGHGDHQSAAVTHSPETDHGSVPAEMPALDR